MDPHTNLLAADNKLCDATPLPLPAINGLYRSRLYTSQVSLNPLVAACDQLLSLAAILKTIDYLGERDKLLHDLAHEIRSFEHRAQLADYPLHLIVAARYALCCLLDETIATTSWGKQHAWAHNNLLALFHNESYGGDRFFIMLERALENIAANLHLIELLYLCLNCGFTGKYQTLTNGYNELASINNKLYQIIGQYNIHYHRQILIHDEPSLAPSAIPTNSVSSNSNKHKKFFWQASGFAIILSGLIYGGISLKLNYMSKPIYSALEQIAKNTGNN